MKGEDARWRGAIRATSAQARFRARFKENPMPSTSQKCTESGVYRSDCNCKEQITISRNETLPPCPKCKKAVNWTLVRAT